MFQKRVHHFINDVILSPAHPIGEVIDYFYRVEFQQRRWPHIHCLFWIKNAPLLDETQEDHSSVEDFIDRYILCDLDSNASNIASQVQLHSKKHSKSCKKGNQKYCFNFPRPPSFRTFICKPPKDTPENIAQLKEQPMAHLTALWQILNSHAELPSDITTQRVFKKAGITQEILEKSLCLLTKKTTVILKRSPQACWINQFNSALLQTWNVNMDMQYVIDDYSCIKYNLSYISKKESEEGDLLRCAQQEAREGNTDALTELRQLGRTYLTHREISVMEVV